MTAILFVGYLYVSRLYPLFSIISAELISQLVEKINQPKQIKMFFPVEHRGDDTKLKRAGTNKHLFTQRS